jgi:hypothetical protein
MRLYGAIAKVDRDDDGYLLVEGIASSETVDSDSEVVTAEAMKAALPDYMRGSGGPLREMHQPIAAGIVIAATVRDDGSTFIKARVVDAAAIAKIDAGVLRGFSIGGKALARDPNDRHRIVKLRLSEISVVDRPSNPDSVFKVWSGDTRDDDETDDQLEMVKAARTAGAHRGDAAVLSFWGMKR